MKLIELFRRTAKDRMYLRKPYIIAEAGVNHEGSMELAKRIIEEAQEAGAHAIKFQTYRANTIASKNSPAYWDTTKEPTLSQHELFKKYDKFWKREFEELRNECDKVQIEFLSTPFDLESARFLNDLMDIFKISSSDITNKPFIDYLCGFGKPIILSTGASYLHEIEEAVEWIDCLGNDLALLHCVLNYPTENRNANLGMILDLKNKFPDKIIGYSDHTLPGDMKALEIAAMLGAEILEKHFTFDKRRPGNDHYHAMDKEDLQLFVRNIAITFDFLGEFKKRALPSEDTARRNARRSLVASRFIPKGKLIGPDDLTWKRPGKGISPKDIEKIIGRPALRDIHMDDIIIDGIVGERNEA